MAWYGMARHGVALYCIVLTIGDKANETDTLFKAWTEKNDIQFKEKTKKLWMVQTGQQNFTSQFCDTESFKCRIYSIFSLAGHLRTAVLANAIKVHVGTVSKGHTWLWMQLMPTVHRQKWSPV